jgi:hypothetical protein
MTEPSPLSRREKAEMNWYAFAEDAKDRLMPKLEALPAEARWIFQMFGKYNWSDEPELVELWIDRDEILRVRYRTPFLLGILRQLSLLYPDKKQKEVPDAALQVRLIDFRADEHSHPNLNLRDCLAQYLKLRFPPEDANDRSKPGIEDDFEVHIEIRWKSSSDPLGHHSYKGTPGKRDLEYWFKETCKALRYAWFKENIKQLDIFLDAAALKNMGPDMLAAGAWIREVPLAERLLELGVNPMQRDSSGGYPLVDACGAGNLDLVRKMIERSADPRRGGLSGVRPLDTALDAVAKGIEEGLEIVKLLLEHGAPVVMPEEGAEEFPDPDQTGPERDSYMGLPGSLSGLSALTRARRMGREDLVKLLREAYRRNKGIGE